MQSFTGTLLLGLILILIFHFNTTIIEPFEITTKNITLSTKSPTTNQIMYLNMCKNDFACLKDTKDNDSLFRMFKTENANEFLLMSPDKLFMNVKLDNLDLNIKCDNSYSTNTENKLALIPYLEDNTSETNTFIIKTVNNQYLSLDPSFIIIARPDVKQALKWKIE
jgi:hypothetical protein